MSAKVQTTKTRKTFFMIGGAVVLLGILLMLQNMSDSLNEDRQSEELIISGQKKNKKGDYKGAVEDFTEAINISPKKYKAYGSRAHSYTQLGEYDKALSDYKKSLKLCKKKQEKSFIHSEIGKLEYQLGNLENACDHFQKSMDMGFAQAETYLSKLCIGDTPIDPSAPSESSESE